MRSSRTLGRAGLRLLGGAILLFSFAPVYRLLDTSVESPFRQASVEIADSTLQLAWWGTLVTVLLAVVLAVLLPAARLRSAAATAGARLVRPRSWTFAVAAAALATGIATVVAYALFQGLFTNIDEIASSLHARYLAHGRLAGPALEMPEFWLIPNMLMVPEGWVSQYPPTHLAAMALVERLGIPVLLGPLSFGAMTAFVALSLDRLLDERPAVARISALLVALSPLLFFLGGGSMNHVTAGALLAAALYAALRARDGSPWWSVASGTAIGLAVAGRPLIGLVLGVVFTLGVWVPTAVGAGAARLGWLSARAAGTVAGGLPIALLLGWYNLRLFGHPLTLGYLVAFGDRHRLGFHMDPWGYEYGMREAVAFTSTDVLAASFQLLETPFPATALIAVALLTGARLSKAAGVLLAWAFLPVVANGYYWFHSSRMLFEAAPAWVALFVLSAAQLASSANGTSGLAARGRDACAWALAVGAVLAVALNVPQRWTSYSWSEETLARITAPSPPATRAIVFVHASWNERVSSTLQGAGAMRQDSVVTLLRRNPICRLHLYAEAREARVRDGRAVPMPDVDLAQVPGTPPDVELAALENGSAIRIRRDEPFSAACARELSADRFGSVALAPLLWQGDLPGLEEGRTLFVRDMGPAKNARLLERYSDRAPFAFTPTEPDAAPVLLPYDEAMRLLWGAPPERAATTGSGAP